MELIVDEYTKTINKRMMNIKKTGHLFLSQYVSTYFVQFPLNGAKMKNKTSVVGLVDRQGKC